MRKNKRFGMCSLSFIGLGLFDERDLSLKALQEAKDCELLFAEFYTSVHESSSIEKLQKLIGKKVEVLKREDVEEGDKVLEAARNSKTGFLIPGDPMMATTHIELRIRAEKQGIKTKLIHGQSIFTAVPGLMGLQPYKFGRSTTIPFKTKGYEPTSPYDVIKANRELGLHTLLLFDIDVERERTLTVHEALKYLLEIEHVKKNNIIRKDKLVCVVANAGSSNPFVKADYIKNIMNESIEHKVQTLVVPGDLHFMELEALIVLAHAPESIRNESTN